MEQDIPARQAAIERAVSNMIWEGAPLPEGNPALNPDQGIVENGTNPMTHPLRKGIIRNSTTSGIGEVQIQQVQP